VTRYRYDGEPHHFACPGGCGELADECACRRKNPLGSLRITAPDPRPPICDDNTKPQGDPA
jgi:hypothetical protein